MNRPTIRDWQSVQQEVRRRIHAREWQPGDLIPNEADLATEFGCARATVNRALRTLAESGLLDRRRKAGTRVAAQPAAKATLTIPVIRQEIEARDKAYGYEMIARQMGIPPMTVSQTLKTAKTAQMLHLQALHLADGAPYAFEDRWINTDVAPSALEAPFDVISGNEWLLQHIPYTHGDISFSAVNASDEAARVLRCAAGTALLCIDRVTWDQTEAVTKVRIAYAPGHQLHTGI